MRLVLTQPGRRRADGASQVRDMLGVLSRARQALTGNDILVLPELIGGHSRHDAYVEDVRWLAQASGAWVVGGSHLRHEGDDVINCGVVAGPDGRIVARYEKSNPYATELADAIGRGRGAGAFEVGGVRFLVMICADFWHAPSFAVAGPAPDAIIVPAFSASQRPSPHMARARWRHAAIARAYEFAAFVAVSDWDQSVRHAAGNSSGVAGLAHPNPTGPAELFRGLGRRRVQAFDISLPALHDLRANRIERGFDLTRHLRGAEA